MWDTWSWMNSAITAKIKADSDEKSRQLEQAINEQKRATEMNIAQLEADTKRYVVDVETASKEKVAEAERLSRESIAEADRKSREKVATLQTIGQVAPKLIPVALGGQIIANKKNDNNKGSGNTTPNTAETGARISTNEKVKSEADKLFPELEPTFKDVQTPKAVKFGLGAALTGAVVSMLSSVPLLF